MIHLIQHQNPWNTKLLCHMCPDRIYDTYPGILPGTPGIRPRLLHFAQPHSACQRMNSGPVLYHVYRSIIDMQLDIAEYIGI